MGKYGSTCSLPTEVHREQYRHNQGRRIITCVVFGMLVVASVGSKFLASCGTEDRPDDTALPRFAARTNTAGPFATTAAVADATLVLAGSEVDEDYVPCNVWGLGCTTPTKHALMGVDLVSYVTLPAGDEPVIGSRKYSSSYGDYQYLFSSARNKALFEADPASYLPAWGGFCGYGIAVEDSWGADCLGPPADISQWVRTHDGRLFFFRSEHVKHKFLENEETLVDFGDARWTSWLGYDNSTYPVDVSCFCSLGVCPD